jgi:predicted nucleotidyltransferase
MLLKKLWKNIRLNKIINKFYTDNKEEIVDIVAFGSTVRGRIKPNDLDILCIFKNKIDDDLLYDLDKKIKKININSEIIGKKYKNLFSSEFLPREDILSDGYSFILKKRLFEAFGYRSFMLFKYSLVGKTQSDRVRFHYVLEGRNDSIGILKKLKAIKFTNSVVLVNVGLSEQFELFLNDWNIEYKKTRILIPDTSIKYMKFR